MTVALDSMVLDEYIKQFLKFLGSERNLSPNTLSAYHNDLRQFRAYVGEEADPKNIVSKKVAGFFVSLREHKGYSAPTVARKMAAVKSFFQYLMREQIITTNPAADMHAPSFVKPLPKYISVTDVDLLLQQVEKDTTTPTGQRNRALLQLLYATGMRVTELVKLDTGDLDLYNHVVRCGRDGRIRTLPFHPTTCETLQDYLENGRQPAPATEEKGLFLNHRGHRLTRQGFWLIMKSVAHDSGVTSTVTPKTLRHSFAAHRLNDGLPLTKLRELLGHANIETTVGMYAPTSGAIQRSLSIARTVRT